MPMVARDLVIGSPEQVEAMFPKLDASQIARLEAFGQQRDAQPHEVILELGDLNHGILVILSGRVQRFRVSAEGETALDALGPRSGKADPGQIKREEGADIVPLR